jgi:hypothetical protein
MNKRKVWTLSLFGLGVLLAVSINFAQFNPTVTAEIPFAFNAAAAHFDAGNYGVNEYSSNHAVLEVKRRDGLGAAFVIAREFDSDATASGKARLVFNKYGEQYFLSQVWLEGGSVGCRLSPSKMEKEVRHTSAAKNLAPEVVQIAAR